jgi:hyperosmotically inducible periplasmic protein
MKIRTAMKLLALLGCVALAPGVYAQSSDSTMSAAPAAHSGKATPADKKLGRDVRKAMAKAQGFDVSNVFVKARGGAVTLSGSVPDGGQIQQGAEIAKGVPGVTSVNNKLTLYSKGNQ